MTIAAPSGAGAGQPSTGSPGSGNGRFAGAAAIGAGNSRHPGTGLYQHCHAPGSRRAGDPQQHPRYGATSGPGPHHRSGEFGSGASRGGRFTGRSCWKAPRLMRPLPVWCSGGQHTAAWRLNFKVTGEIRPLPPQVEVTLLRRQPRSLGQLSVNTPRPAPLVSPFLTSATPVILDVEDNGLGLTAAAPDGLTSGGFWPDSDAGTGWFS